MVRYRPNLVVPHSVQPLEMNPLAWRALGYNVLLTDRDLLTDVVTEDGHTLLGRRVVLLGDRYLGTLGFPPDAVENVWYLLTEDVKMVAMYLDPYDPDVGHKLRLAALPCIHVEGPEGAGKSTLVEQLSYTLSLPVQPTQGPCTSREECLERVRVRIGAGQLCDRSSGLISEIVYGSVLRGHSMMTLADLWPLFRAVRFIYCRPPDALLKHEPREGEDAEHVRQVNEKSAALIDRYDEVMVQLAAMGAEVHVYDRTRHYMEELVLCVE